MTSIEQVVISGVRSFNPDISCRQGIKFQKPVTIILGPNGSGKTTVIEALRNCCTGEVPANTGKGAAFIHDPKVSGETEVKAQVKLQFRTLSGQQMLIGRSYQLTQMANGKQKFETLDVSLQTRDPKTGQVVAQSYKCGDIDKLIPDIMGISKPILDNVIFLHQDDTNWPLAEASKLKKKFDDIFSSTRYTKALDEIRKIVKENKKKISEHTATVAVLKEKRQIARRIRAQVEETRAKMTVSETQIKSIDEQIAKIEARIEETTKQTDEIQKLESDTIKLQGTLEALIKQRQEMGKALTVVSEETDDQLKQALQKFGKFEQEMRNALVTCEDQLKSLQRETVRENETMVQLRSEKEHLHNQTTAHQRRVASLRSLIADIKSVHSINAPVVGDEDIDPNVMVKFYQEFSEKLSEARRNREQMRTKHRRTQEDAENLLAEARNKKSHSVLRQENAESRLEELKPKLRTLKDSFATMASTEKAMEASREKVAQFEESLSKLRTTERQTAARLKHLQKEHLDKQIRVDTLRAEAGSRQDEQNAAHKLRMLREECERLTKLSDPTRTKLESRLQQLTGKKPTNLKDDISYALRTKQSAVARTQKQLTEADREVTLSRKELDVLTARQSEIQKTIETQSALFAGITSEYRKPLPEILQKAEAREEKDRKAVSKMHALRMCHENFTSQAEEEGCCPVCARDMDESQLGTMQRNMHQKLQDVPAAIAEKENSLAKTQKLVKKVRELMPAYIEVAHLQEQGPLVAHQRSAASDKFESSQQAHKDLTTKLEALKFEESEIITLGKASEKYHETVSQKSELERRIHEEEAQIIKQHGVPVRALDLVLSEIESLQKDVDGIVAEQQSLMQLTERARNEGTSLTEGYQEAMRAVDIAQIKSQEKARVRKEYDLLLEEYRAGNQTISDIKSTLPSHDEEIAKYTADLRLAREVGDAEEKEATEVIERHQQSLSSIKTLADDIKKHIQEKYSEKVEIVTAQLAQIESASRERQRKTKTLSDKLLDYQRKISQQENTKRELEANLRYRLKCQEVKTGERDLQKLKQIIKERSHGHQAIWASLDEFREQKAALDTEKATYVGQLQANDATLKERQKELLSEKYSRIDDQYNSTLIKLATAQMTEEDLARYHTALDCALMKYHDEKITEMNEIIKDLWIRTYKGNDIDHIELRSDVELSATSRTRNYNYRVVMVRGGVSLDMRGRCSAGQRVLASLVVRLALSQAFCCDCGILALDEPTTNLDVENIESLAYALTEIIAARRGQSNFQLIIITHDEQFVRRIGQACGTETVYHISKDSEGHYSTITERDFAEMM